MFGDDIQGELFNKIGAETSGNPIELLNKAEAELKDGDPIEAKKLLKQIIDITGTNGKRYETQSQHRASAQEYYIQSVAYQLMDMTAERDSNYLKVIESLLAYAKNAMAFDENDKGMTSATLAGLVCIMAGNNNRALEIYNQFMATAQQKQNSQGLVQLLYSLGYLLDALKNTNVEALSNAQNFISKDLLPMLNTAKLTGFNKLLTVVIQFVQSEIERKIKMPKIQLETELDKDILFNQVFNFKVLIENVGEGYAKDVKVDIQMDTDLELLHGKTQTNYALMDQGGKEELSYQLRFQTAQDVTEVMKSVKGTVSFLDMLGNGHKQYLGPLDIEIRAISKTTEYMDRLNSINSEYEALNFEEIDQILQLVLPEFKSFYSTTSNLIKQNIDDKEYDKANIGFTYLEKLKDWQRNVFLEDGVNNSIVEKVRQQIAEAEQQLETKLKDELTAEKEKALEELTKQKDDEIVKAVEDKQKELNEKYKTEITNLKETHFKELGKINQTHENKLAKSLADQEQTLENKFIQEMNDKSDEFEKTLRELRNQHDEELNKEKDTLKKELTDRHTKEVEKLKTSKEEEIRKITEANEAAMENALQTQKTKLDQERKVELEKAEQKLQSELKQKYEQDMDEMKKKLNKEISQKTKTIEDLERQLRDLKSSSSGK
ncbi:MAG: hypothetical protein INQ03_05285 [Candidatus Heimdallarchaeota archaeon]|nr:hypothetical protein [Candidatus Heimdallarchaeota archaeon]